MSDQDLLDSVRKSLGQIFAVFLSYDYDDKTQGWVVEDHLRAIEHHMREWASAKGMVFQDIPRNRRAPK